MTQIQKELRALEKERAILLTVLDNKHAGEPLVARIGYRLREIHLTIMQLENPAPIVAPVKKSWFQRLSKK